MRSDTPIALGVIALVVWIGVWRQQEADRSPAAGRQPAGAVTDGIHVRYGDPIAGLSDGVPGLHCPGTGDEGWSVATHAALQFAGGETLSCSLNGELTLDGMVGRCFVGDDELAEILVRWSDHARCPRYDPEHRSDPVRQEAGPPIEPVLSDS